MKKVISLLFIVSILFSISCDTFYSHYPSDEYLIEHFQNNEADFDKLNQMVKEDSEFVRIACDFNWTKESIAYPRPKSQKDLPDERWNDYRRLFRKLELTKGILNHQPDSVWFLSSTSGLLSPSLVKGYTYSIEEVSPIVESLDNPNFDRPEFEGKVFKRLFKFFLGQVF